ncbi:hypothetical protein RDI58_004297 [Solanum bulbocastanum]|uniref:Uncharacterized protein n=1 Tax=Solanum bulbocastanum TaxID=147425 RepID=A0AAN8U5K2_SOLBU
MTGGRDRASTGHAGKSSVRKRKRLAVEKGRDPTPSEKHLHVHTQGRAEKSFVGEQSQIRHERSQEILLPQTQGHSDIDDQCQAYYQATGGEKMRRVYSLESQAKSYHSRNLHTSSGSDATSPATLLNVKSTLIGDLLLNVPSTPIGNVEELVMQLIPILMDHMLPIFVEGVRRALSSRQILIPTTQQLWHLLLLLLLTLTRFMHRFLMTMVTLQPRIS